MADKFDKMMEKFLNPVSDLGGRVKDSLYFLREDGCFVFSHGYYHPTPGYFIGKIIYYPLAEGDADIWGRRYQAMHKAWIDGEHVAIMNDVQIVKQYEVDPSLDPDKPRPLVADYTLEFPLKDFVGYFDPARSLELCREMYPETVKPWAAQAAELMQFPPDKMGVTGSLAYGKIEEADMDFDVIFMGNLEENLLVRDQLHRSSEEPARKVFEFGRYWPIRIYHNGFLLCPFFVYENWEDVPLAQAEVSVIERDVTVSGTIVDDTHNAYLPIILELKDAILNGKARDNLRVICYDGSIRGEYWEGERIWLEGRLLRIADRKGEYDAVAVDISFNISKKKPDQYPI
jgi:predicted nucleotidyltransferase